MEWLKELLKTAGIEEEQIETIVASATKEAPKHVVPKTKYNEISNAKKELETQLTERDTQLEELKKVDAAGLQAKIQELQMANDTTKQEYEAKLQEQQYNFALESALTGAKVKNVKAVKALLDSDKIKLDGDKLLGLDDQLEVLKTSDAYLFDGEQQQQQQPPSFSTGQHNPPGGKTEPATLAEAFAMQFNKQ